MPKPFDLNARQNADFYVTDADGDTLTLRNGDNEHRTWLITCTERGITCAVKCTRAQLQQLADVIKALP